MGKRDSSKSRVVPVFDRLLSTDPTGKDWLLRLLRLGSRSAVIGSDLVIGTLRPDHPTWWGKNERKLYPPITLLEWLVRNLREPANAKLWGSDAVKARRQKLVERHPETVLRALQELKAGKRRGWHILEGRSQPDACLETDHVLLVVEGKRTERKATSATTWMADRSQIIRHMDAAREVRGDRRVLGLMIVEGDGGPDALHPSEHWQKESESQVSIDMLTRSLPHRSTEERREIADGFLGVTTWQRVCQEFGVPWPPMEDPA